MSRQSDARNLFASKTPFAALPVESGEDTEEEEFVEVPEERCVISMQKLTQL